MNQMVLVRVLSVKYLESPVKQNSKETHGDKLIKLYNVQYNDSKLPETAKMPDYTELK